jgi:hypothetical protein
VVPGPGQPPRHPHTLPPPSRASTTRRRVSRTWRRRCFSHRPPVSRPPHTARSAADRDGQPPAKPPNPGSQPALLGQQVPPRQPPGVLAGAGDRPRPPCPAHSRQHPLRTAGDGMSPWRPGDPGSTATPDHRPPARPAACPPLAAPWRPPLTP